MSKAYHTKHSFNKIAENETGNSARRHIKARRKASRHPGGTRATGLRQEMIKGGKLVIAKGYRDRFGLTEEKSSRFRRWRRAAKHAIRSKKKNALRTELAIKASL